MEDKKFTRREKCEPTYHRYYSLEPQAMEDGSEILVISVCANCGDALEYRTSIRRGDK